MLTVSSRLLQVKVFGEALDGSDVIIIPTELPRKPDMTRHDLFNINGSIIKGLCIAIAKHRSNLSITPLSL
jgi:malate dehydrogenase